MGVKSSLEEGNLPADTECTARVPRVPGYAPGDGADALEAARLGVVTQVLTQRPWTECVADSSVLQFWLPEL